MTTTTDLTGPATRTPSVGGPPAVVLSLLTVFLLTVVISLCTLVSGVAVPTPPTTSLALAGYPDMAGTASSFLGVARFAFGGLAAPLVGLGGDGAVPLGLVILAGAALAAITYARTIRSTTERALT